MTLQNGFYFLGSFFCILFSFYYLYVAYLLLVKKKPILFFPLGIYLFFWKTLLGKEKRDDMYRDLTKRRQIIKHGIFIFIQ